MSKLLTVTLLIGLILAVSSCGDRVCDPCGSHTPEWVLLPDSMNLAVLIVDYSSYAFEGGNLSYYAPCATCDAESLPIEMDFRDTWDFALVSFAYTETGSTLFKAGITWNGRGSIEYPSRFEPSEAFGILHDEVEEPPDPARYQAHIRLDRDTLLAKTDSAWAAVQNLDIVHVFAEDHFRVGYFFYTPTVGAFNPFAAKWVIFLYRGVSL